MSGTVPTPWTWNFPPCPQWVPESDGQRIRQARKVAEEVVEALHAVDQWGDENVSGYVMELVGRGACLRDGAARVPRGHA